LTTTGVLYMVWGDESPDDSIASLKRWHPELPVHVERLGEGSTLLDKAKMRDMTPFDVTLYLDADTLVLGRLDYGFAKAERHGLACCICENPWLARYSGFSGDDRIEYNTGVLFFERDCVVMRDWPVRARVPENAGRIEWGGNVMEMNDQLSFSLAVNGRALPFILPCNWNFRVQFHRACFGPIKVWHSRLACPAAVIEGSHRNDPMFQSVFNLTT
jgi:hypothetical protein